jgi:uncharacterized membrane protein YjgN (DUF898 family)
LHPKYPIVVNHLFRSAMEQEKNESTGYKLNFEGKGSTFFGIVIVNWLLTIITLTIYYPWAKARKLQFLYSATSFNGDNFTFSGTGLEMLKGYIKVLVLFVIIYGVFFGLYFMEHLYLAITAIYLILFAIIPLAIHGSYRYRFSRTSWRGIRFGYRGKLKELFVNFLKWTFLCIVTLGIYGCWMEINLRKYLIRNIRMGDVEFDYEGKGTDYFLLNLLGGFLTVITLGIYSFWYYKKLFSFYVDNIVLYKDGQKIRCHATLTAGDIFKVGIVNLLLMIFTLGLGYAWVVTRSLRLVFSRIELEGDIDLNTIQQTEADYNDATGDDMSSFLDIDLIF